ncbi:hypothetical protein M9H77_35455 [Catharanthus roseus]|uniref:Uncharacterized protein n=1 Tax=Catharanthus roseus TaxID=4058 RepID=A0ACB9ZSR6_CATRO|nr:hypothetical protein M9H77_35455 [Catharanthus roseus]
MARKIEGEDKGMVALFVKNLRDLTWNALERENEDQRSIKTFQISIIQGRKTKRSKYGRLRRFKTTSVERSRPTTTSWSLFQRKLKKTPTVDGRVRSTIASRSLFKRKLSEKIPTTNDRSDLPSTVGLGNSQFCSNLYFRQVILGENSRVLVQSKILHSLKREDSWAKGGLQRSLGEFIPLTDHRAFEVWFAGWPFFKFFFFLDSARLLYKEVLLQINIFFFSSSLSLSNSIPKTLFLFPTQLIFPSYKSLSYQVQDKKIHDDVQVFLSTEMKLRIIGKVRLKV